MLELPILPDGESESTHLSVALEKSNISKPRRKRPPSFVATRDDELKSTTFDELEAGTGTSEDKSETVTSGKCPQVSALPGMSGMNAFKLPDLSSIKLKSAGTKKAAANAGEERNNAGSSIQSVMLKPSGRMVDSSIAGKPALPMMPQNVDFRANLKKTKTATEPEKCKTVPEDRPESENCSVSQNRFKFSNIPVQQNAAPSMTQLKAAAAERKLKEAKAAAEAKATHAAEEIKSVQTDSTKTIESDKMSVPMDIEPNPLPVNSSDNVEMDSICKDGAEKKVSQVESADHITAESAKNRHPISSTRRFTEDPVSFDIGCTENVPQPTQPNSISVSPLMKFEDSKKIFSQGCSFENQAEQNSNKKRTQSLILIDESKCVKNRIKFFLDREYATGASSKTNSLRHITRKSKQ